MTTPITIDDKYQFGFSLNCGELLNLGIIQAESGSHNKAVAKATIKNFKPLNLKKSIIHCL